MSGYIVLDSRTKKTLAIFAGICVLVLVVGILVGYFSDRKRARQSCSVSRSVRDSCHFNRRNWKFYSYVSNYVKTQVTNLCIPKGVRCNDYALPKNYIAYHVNGKAVTIDGKLDERAWANAPWSSKFVDMRGVGFGSPRLSTMMKMIWDDSNLYVAIKAAETDLWAERTRNDTPVYKDNGLEMLLDRDGSLHNYKQIQVNVLGTIYDLMFTKSPWDDGDRSKNWSSRVQHAVSADGTINTPGDTDKSWTAELAIPFDSLAENTTVTRAMPAIDDVWFIQFGRSEWKLDVLPNNTYIKYPNSTCDWWSWNPCGTINLHLQDRWGLVQFKRNPRDRRFNFSKWHIYKSLFDMMYAMKRYQAMNGKYTDQVLEMGVPPHVLSERCVEVPTVKLVKRNGTKDFEITVKSRLITHPPAHIRSDRYIWFDS